MNETLDEFVKAGPAIQRPGLRTMLALALRPRGRAILRRVPLAQQTADSVIAMARYDDPEVARPLGWDADAVCLRGRDLRRSEGRP